MGKGLGLEKRTHSQRMKNSINKSVCLGQGRGGGGSVCLGVYKMRKRQNEKFQS